MQARRMPACRLACVSCLLLFQFLNCSHCIAKVSLDRVKGLDFLWIFGSRLERSIVNSASWPSRVNCFRSICYLSSPDSVFRSVSSNDALSRDSWLKTTSVKEVSSS
jgi:hypothetical protein